MHESAAIESLAGSSTVAIRDTQLPDCNDRRLLADTASFHRLLLPGGILAAAARRWLIRGTRSKQATDHYGYADVSKNPDCLRYHVTHPCTDITPNRLDST